MSGAIKWQAVLSYYNDMIMEIEPMRIRTKSFVAGLVMLSAGTALAGPVGVDAILSPGE